MDHDTCLLPGDRCNNEQPKVEMKPAYILHIMLQEKFTSGYITFMQNCMTQYAHQYIVKENADQYELTIPGGSTVYYIKSYFDLLFDREIRAILEGSCKIIISGVFGFDIPMALMPKDILKKTYLQFWGGDFYDIPIRKSKLYTPRQWVRKNVETFTKHRCIKECAAVILLLDEEYERFSAITGIRKRYFVAPVCGDGSIASIFNRLENRNKPIDPYYIMVGNSASESNNHFEAFDILSKYETNDMRIVCPLSYGPVEYAKTVIRCGKQKFGEKFVAITDFMPEEEYFEFLSKVTVALFLNRRQEAMGNISVLLRLGGKVYLRDDTSMYDSFMRKGYKLYHVDDIDKQDFDEFIFMPSECKDENKTAFLRTTDITQNVYAWNKVFLDKG